MRLYEFVTELRKNPELNVKIPKKEILEPLAQDPRVFLSYTKLPKLGINPNPKSINTPAAVYAYPLSYIWNDIKDDLRNVPFAGYGDHIYVFRYDGPILDVSKFSESDFKKTLKKLHGFFSFLKRPFTGEPEGPGYMMPFSIFLDYTRRLAQEKQRIDDINVAGPKHDPKRVYPSSYAFTWNEILRRSTGYDAFIDPGLSIIHGNEPVQAFFLLPTKLKIIHRIDL